jgi:hypothetical protein
VVVNANNRNCFKLLSSLAIQTMGESFLCAMHARAGPFRDPYLLPPLLPKYCHHTNPLNFSLIIHLYKDTIFLLIDASDDLIIHFTTSCPFPLIKFRPMLIQMDHPARRVIHLKDASFGPIVRALLTYR